MNSRKSASAAVTFVVAALLGASGAEAASTAATERSLTELRNTVVNLLQGLVERGVITRDQAEQMVKDAQDKAAEDSRQAAAAEAEDAGAIRVPYVPEIVKEEIRKQVTAELAPEVAKEVAERAKDEGWGVPAALPDWARRVRISGDLRVRGQGDTFASDNVQNSYLDFLTVNDRGGIDRAGISAFANTTEDRQRLRARLRLGVDAELGHGYSMGMRFTTGNLRDPVSTNQTLGNTGARYQFGIDQAWARWYGQSSTARQSLALVAGRIPNPWQSTDLVWDQDLSFEGVSANYRYSFSGDDTFRRNVFATVGAFPLEEVELSSRDKWMYGAQLGFDWHFAGGSRLRAAAALYDFANITGQRNALEDTRLDYTAPKFLQRGNSLFDIRNTSDPTANLFALMAEYRLANVTLQQDWRLSERYRISLIGDYVRNIGYDEEDIERRTTFFVPERAEGYLLDLAVGAADMQLAHAWRVTLGYRHLERDAVLDAFTDSDFRLGGTDVEGYTFTLDYALSPKNLLRMRYLSASEIDGAPFGVDVLQLDFNSQF